MSSFYCHLDSWEISSLENSPISHVPEYVSQWHWKLSGLLGIALDKWQEAPLRRDNWCMHSFSFYFPNNKKKVMLWWPSCIMWPNMTFLEGEHSIPHQWDRKKKKREEAIEVTETTSILYYFLLEPNVKSHTHPPRVLYPQMYGDKRNHVSEILVILWPKWKRDHHAWKTKRRDFKKRQGF